ncbi:CD82 antigen [Rhynchocyon petersi]
MGSACVKITKYFLFLFNLLFFILGAVMLGFGVWILVDKSSFISVLQTSSTSLKVAAYIFISVGAVTMLMGFLGCIGAVNEVRCLLGLVKEEMGDIVLKLIKDYGNSSENSLQETWDYVQEQVECCGWVSFLNWTENEALMNRSITTYPCSCHNKSQERESLEQKGFCTLSRNSNQSSNNAEEWPVYRKGCMEQVQMWLQENLGIILGVCGAVAVTELLGMILSICLCRNIHTEDYSKVPKY